MLGLFDVLGLDRVLLVGHDWGGYVGYRMVLTAPQRFDGYLVMNMAHPWVSPRTMGPHLWRLWYQVPMATIGAPLQRHTRLLARLFDSASKMDADTARVYVERFRDPIVARTARDTYRTFLLRELPASGRGRAPHATVPIRCLFGTGDAAIHPSLAAAETADADGLPGRTRRRQPLRHRRAPGPGAVAPGGLGGGDVALSRSATCCPTTDRAPVRV